MWLLPLALTLTVVAAAPALAAPGDPRLIQGTVEWPATLAGVEPFVVLRSDDGHTYYVDVMVAQRLTDSRIEARSRIAILGLEGTKPHEIIAVALGSGDAAALYSTLAHGTAAAARSKPSGPAPDPAATQPSAGTPPAAAPTTPPIVCVTPAPAPSAGAPQASAPSAVTPQPPAAASAASATVPEDTPPPRVAGPRWMTLLGKVHRVAAQTLLLRQDDGQIAVIDTSKLEFATDLRLTPGSPVEVIVVPVGKKFHATGFVEPERATPKSTAAKRRR